MGTFRYVAIVPEDPMRSVWKARFRNPSDRDDVSTGPEALVGSAPSIRVSDAGETPHPGWHRGRWLPSVRLARLTLAADATRSSDEIFVDMEIIRALQPGDVVHVVRTPCAGLAIGALRDDRLLFSAGAITEVPAGRDLEVRYPGELLRKVEALYAEVDGDFELPELPVEFVFESKRYMYCRANRKVGPYRIFMIQGYRPGLPGEDECGAISREGVSPETAVISTAQLFEGGGHGIVVD